ncbi:sodium/glutamate symporter [Pigmentiphaga aceris]|uniref:Sodium/glutamate symporter n=1 Tax=Pigmentiphaga aceris TaxID=1940612 RepID=A0A5C0B3R1_9BURK|nr:sodium/glutamate symporter [Pigmentiphaga aceris]
MIVQLDIAQTVGVAAFVLVLGEFLRRRVDLLARYFIPGPVIGGLIFSLLAFACHQAGWFTIQFDAQMRSFLLLVFFTTIGFSASLELLKKGGVAVSVFLIAAIGLVLAQNALGVGLASALGIHPLLGLAAGSVALTGGHGTAAAFGPLMEQAGATGALPASIAAATWGLVAGCAIGGPLGSLLMRRHGLTGRSKSENTSTKATVHHDEGDENLGRTAMYAVLMIAFSIGIGTVLVDLLADAGVAIPAYLGPMMVAAVIRNVLDWRGAHLPVRQLDVVGVVSLSFFLAIALMSMKLWELADIAGPLVIILIGQTVLMFLYAYFITFRMVGRDYDAAVIASGHCGFGLGATSNAMANMQAFTSVNGPSHKAFFVIPLVGSLFIDFFNAVIITAFMGYFS